MSRRISFLGSVSDLMAGLMIVFLFIAISYMLEVRAREGEIQKRAEGLEGALGEAKRRKAEAENAKREADTLNDNLEEQKKVAEDAKRV